MATFVT